MQTVTSKDGTTIAYDRTGTGPAVVLVGGAFSHRAFPKMVELAELLSTRFMVINYDRRGRGDSGDTSAYTVEREIEDLAAVIDAIGGRASLWGWSSGGILALYAAAAGLPIDRVALYEPPFLIDDSRTPPPAGFAARIDELLATGRRGPAVTSILTTGMGMPGPIATALRLTPMWKRLKAIAHTFPYDWAIIGDNHAGRPLRAAEWSASTTPTLVLAGAKSPAQLRNAARAIAEILPNAQHRELPKQSHNPSMKALAPVIAEFLAQGRQAKNTHSVPGPSASR
jgi:pimeloyl-ACP methyl ester carboxylesterase